MKVYAIKKGDEYFSFGEGHRHSFFTNAGHLITFYDTYKNAESDMEYIEKSYMNKMGAKIVEFIEVENE